MRHCAIGTHQLHVLGKVQGHALDLFSRAAPTLCCFLPSVNACSQDVRSRISNMFRPSLTVSRRMAPLFVVRSRMQSFAERRYFSAKAIYGSLPCTLHYYSPRQTSSLYDQADKNTRPYHIVDEEVNASKNGLIYPAVKATSSSSILNVVW